MSQDPEPGEEVGAAYHDHGCTKQRRGSENNGSSECSRKEESEAEKMIQDANLTVVHGDAQYSDDVEEGK